MIYVEDLMSNFESVDGITWRPAKPEPGPFINRLRDAWYVLTGRYEAVHWRKASEIEPVIYKGRYSPNALAQKAGGERSALDQMEK